jgi:predicted glutamine amidotransferase
MCGLIGAVSKDGHFVNEEVHNQFQDQSSRGTRGFGAAMLDKENDKEIIKVRRATDEVSTLLDLKLFDSKLILFHHRMPTSSDNKIQQTHPILVSNDLMEYDWLIAHNGVIQNSEFLKKSHNELGIHYTTDNGDHTRNYNDSESLAIELALFLEQKSDGVKARGSAAVIGLQMIKGTREPLCFFFGRNGGNPLHWSENEHILFVCSEGKGMEVKTNEYHFVDLTKKNLPTQKVQIIVPYEYIYTQGRSLPIHNARDDKDDDEARYQAFQEGQAQDDAIIDEFSFTTDPNLVDESEKMYDELEEIVQKFVETICNPDSVDYAETYVTELETAMRKQMEKMEKYHTDAINKKEEEETIATAKVEAEATTADALD